jgi:hypothetical protein
VTTTPDPIDIINMGCIAASEAEVDASHRTKYHVGGGGYFARSITGWVFCVYGAVTTVSVPTTIAALEAREARQFEVAA